MYESLIYASHYAKGFMWLLIFKTIKRPWTQDIQIFLTSKKLMFRYEATWSGSHLYEKGGAFFTAVCQRLFCNSLSRSALLLSLTPQNKELLFSRHCSTCWGSRESTIDRLALQELSLVRTEWEVVLWAELCKGHWEDGRSPYLG